ncbi:MAG: formylglycine-generating enzyme family protein [Haliscomenobacteraceae bacterium CHB4]|nr:formylglycine-generating enzyme family protein [Haliscomenobacteraceae bacterium CHB4]
MVLSISSYWLLFVEVRKNKTPPTTPLNFTEKQPVEQIIELEMVFVEGGAFTMGCTAEQVKYCEDNEKPPHKVTINSFYIGKYEVTQAQWKAVMDNNPSYFKDCDDCPVESVNWNDVQVFLQKLNAKTGKKYRLPTEAEWEYAARGGNKSQKYIYAGGSDLSAVAWYGDNSNSKTHPVGSKSPNELGLYDMSGNVWELCEDIGHDNYSGAPTDGNAWTTGGDSSNRINRGGSIGHYYWSARVANRELGDLDTRILYYGFRVVRD